MTAHSSLSLLFFFAAALVIALTPGPGIFYVAARSLAGGRREGLASSLGTGLGGLVHVAAGALGASAILMASAEAFAVLKLLGAGYLVYLGIRTWRSADTAVADLRVAPAGGRRAFRDGVVVEALNPKTAAFFLAFIPQFVDPAAHDFAAFALHFAALGLISVAMNTAVDVLVTLAAAAFRDRLARQPRLIRRLRQGAGGVLCGLGVSLALAQRPS
ncbi:MAG TPA: LysE family translocator [Alphaproteobacteria bacterium]|nr:LysE family translocator [Alphaproteobacteria bacterium]